MSIDPKVIDQKFDQIISSMEQIAQATARAVSISEETRSEVVRLEGKVDNLEGKVDNLGGRVDRLEGHAVRMEERFDRLEKTVVDSHVQTSARLDRIEAIVERSDAERASRLYLALDRTLQALENKVR